MTAPALIRRNLTVNFDRVIDFASQTPQTIEVVVIPLSVPSDAASSANVTLVGGLQRQTVLLSHEVNPVIFQLVPSNEPGLTEAVNYRIAWRQGIVGRTFTYDFAMPDVDISFDALFDLGNIIGGEVYLQQTDLGVPGRVARLNNEGRVVDALGTPVADQADVSGLQGQLNVEIVNRARADASNRSAVDAELAAQTVATLSTARQYADAADAATNNALASERNLRQAGDNSIGGQITALQASLTDLSDTLPDKADLDSGGHIPLGEIPPAAITKWVMCSTANDRLALRYPQDVQLGDVAVAPTGSYLLTGIDPVNPANWYLLNKVTSVNGHSGVVTLTASDVGAVATSDGSVSIAQVTNLSTTLDGKASASDLTALTGTVSGITSDTSIVHTVDGLIPHALNDANMAYVNGSNEITKKDGTVLSAGGSSDLLFVENGLTGSSNAVPRIGTLETRVTAIEVGGGGGGETPGLIEFWQASSPTGNFVSDVILHSPFGFNHANPSANVDGYYLDPAGAPSGEVVWPYISENGHLKLRKWNEAGPADPVYALSSALTSLSTTVGTNQTNLTNLTTTVGGKASQAAVDTLTTTVGTKASQSDVTALTTTVGNKAEQTALLSVSGTVSTIQTALTSKADLDGGGHVPLAQLPSFAISKTTGLQAAIDGKADRSGPGSTVPLVQLPAIPGSTQVTGWSTKADLVDGLIRLDQMPETSRQNIHEVANRAAMLALTTLQAQQGSICSITATTDQGSYFLNSSDPSQFSNWVKLATPIPLVASVNGQTGTVVLNAANVGALDASSPVAASSAVGGSPLATQLSSLVTTAALNTAVTSQMQSTLTSSVEVKRADYVASSAVSSLSGQQSADGVIMPVGAIVLLTAQSSSLTNGCWQVNSGAWSRAADFTTGSWLVGGALVLVSNKTAGANGGTNNNTIWRMTAASGAVDTNANNWTKAMIAGPPLVYTQGNGVSISNQVVTAVAATGGGCVVTSGGIGIDTIVARRFVGAVPASNPATITHNLNTTSVSVTLIDVASGDVKLIGATITGANTVSLDFATIPSLGQYRVICVG